MKPGKRILAIAVSAAMLGITASPAFAASDISKDETVYVVTQADGSQSEVTVSDHLVNGSRADEIKDKTNLKDIENVKGDETFEKGDGDTIIWNAEGNDIFYDGTTEKTVPVRLGISYFLNGEEVKGSKLEGANGDLEIVINYRNEARSEDGTTVPFIAMTGFIAEDDCFQDIEIDHGKVIDDGDKKIVAALAMPGLQDSLDLDQDLVDLDLSDTVTIKGTAKDFSVQDMMTIVTNSVFDEIDSDEFGDLDYDDQISELNKGAKQLMDGSNQLYRGIDTLYANMPTLKNGVNQLASGADKLSRGTDEAMKGSKKLTGGIEKLGNTLSSKLSEAAAGVFKMKVGSEQILGGMQKMQAGLDGDGTVENPGAVEGLEQVEVVLQRVIDGMEASGSSEEDMAELKEALKQLQQLKEPAKQVSNYMDQVDSAVTANKSLLEKTKYKDLINATSGAKQAANKVAGGLEKVPDISGASSSGGSLEDAILALKKCKAGVVRVRTGLGQMSDTMPVMITGMSEINGGLTQLDDMFQKITDMSGQISDGLGALVKGSKSLTAGEVKLSGGAKELAKGMRKLQDNSATLSNGVGKLDSGSLKLSKGMATLYEDGIRKIVDLYNDDLKGSIDDLEDVIDAGQSYQSFTEKPKGMDGSVKFIYKTSLY